MAWNRFTQENIQRSKRERDNSKKLCNAIRDCLRSSSYEVISHFTVVNASFKNRIYNLEVSKNNLQSQLLQVCTFIISKVFFNPNEVIENQLINISL